MKLRLSSAQLKLVILVGGLGIIMLIFILIFLPPTMKKFSKDKRRPGIVESESKIKYMSIFDSEVKKIKGDTIAKEEFTGAVIWAGLIMMFFLFALLCIVIKRRSDVLENVSVRIKTSAESLASASGFFISSSSSLAKRTSDQMIWVGEASRCMDEMTSMINQATEKAHKARDVVCKTSAFLEQVNNSVALLLNPVEVASKGSLEDGPPMEETKKPVTRGIIPAPDVRSVLNKLLYMTRTIEVFMEEISSISEDQAKAIPYINRNVAEIDSITRENASHAYQSTVLSDILDEQAINMEEMAKELITLVGPKLASSRPATTSPPDSEKPLIVQYPRFEIEYPSKT